MAEQFDPFKRPEFITLTPRSRCLSHLSSVYEAQQYEGRPNWWTGVHSTGGEPVALRKRKPCVRYKLAKAATNQVVRFLYGDGRFPGIEVEQPDEEDSGGAPLSDENVEALNKWISALIEHARLTSVERARAKRGISLGTAVTVISLDAGRFCFEHPNPQHCWAEFESGDPNNDVTRLVWCYPTARDVVGKDGKPEQKIYLFRREWDQQNVYIYKDVEVEHLHKLEDVEWGAPEVAPHGLSFCPVLWTRNCADDADGIDGLSLFEDSDEGIEALDLTLSRRYQGIIYLGAPQPYETGVDDDDGPEANATHGGPAGYTKGLAGTAPDGDVAPRARRIGPDSMWTYHGREVTVGMLETTGKAFDVGTLHVNDIRSRLLEEWGVVLTSMSDTVSKVTTGAEMSARFLALAHAPLIGLVQEYRHNWWSFSLERLLTMCLRITAEMYQQNRFVLVPNSDKVAAIVQPMLAVEVGTGDDGQPIRRWSPPRLTPKWGAFFEPSALETKERTESAVAAKEGRLISGKTATQFVAHDYDIGDVEEEIDDIEEERQADEDRESEREMKAIEELDKRAAAGGGVGISKPSGGGAAGDAASSGGGGRGSGPSAQAAGSPTATR